MWPDVVVVAVKSLILLCLLKRSSQQQSMVHDQKQGLHQNSKASSGFVTFEAPSFMPPRPVEPVRLAPNLLPLAEAPNRPLPRALAAGRLLAAEPA